MVRVLAIALLLVVGALAAAFVEARDRLAPASETPAPRIFVIERGEPFGGIARRLEDAGLIKSALAARAAGRWQGIDGSVQVGEYELSPHQSVSEILEVVTSGRVKTWPVTVPEGSRASDIARRLAEAGLVEEEAFLTAVADPALAAELGVPGETLEGYLYPDTYQLPPRPVRGGRGAHDGAAVRARLERRRGHARGRLDAREERDRDAGLDRREGDRRARGAPADRGRLPQPARAGHAPRDRPDGDLRHPGLRRQPAQAPPAGLEQSVQHVPDPRPAPRPDREPGRRGAPRRRRAERDRLPLLRVRATTARTSSRRRTASTSPRSTSTSGAAARGARASERLRQRSRHLLPRAGARPVEPHPRRAGRGGRRRRGGARDARAHAHRRDDDRRRGERRDRRRPPGLPPQHRRGPHVGGRGGEERARADARPRSRHVRDARARVRRLDPRLPRRPRRPGRRHEAHPRPGCRTSTCSRAPRASSSRAAAR